MKVILLERINKLGRLGDVVEVRPGYGRNFLVPQGKAVLATPSNLASFAERKAALEAAEQERLQAAQARAAALADVAVRIALQAGEDGRLFGSVSHHDIARLLGEMGHPVSHSEVRLADGPIKRVGEHTARLHLHPEVELDIHVVVERA
ncbi:MULTISPECIES: 50S ribosomal protein L9 [Acidithiobacillus]|jgi:large subunit ribosomal protein L9|uniref:Large ribosomal subunit protein bL9 n=3 Tax=Acidithiobacillus caldus TaxID=33059 RepID=F9ZQ96_ACICS|nr:MULTISPECIES: 50S ribosomal protein L9 [Acidithiobacillus]AEK56889.1 LSU ribosomal protein L9p [Acidithiobacillus caldus SM-1]AIA54156.1 LSU ribosomal protein L9p [Acidithiobacillus caldus ATCC 51756]AUW31690.1 50S ribosomal protein L9 [Acidithiobacillus caldus]MBU2729020.1 50S ribosomal protein L9 [Acidithiobacillus caldus]MBU2736860.1 50S ribosomal protein L9 [Acidithiobacillus caldus ATCC 51756]